MKTKRTFSLITLVALTSFSVFAQKDEFEHVEVLDQPRYSLTDRFSLDVDFTFLPLDAYYKPMLLEIAGNYQFNDFLAFEPVRFGFSVLNHDTGLTNNLQNRIRSQTGDNSFVLSDNPLKDLRYHVGSAAYVNLLYSKSNFFNRKVAYHYWQIGSGFSYYDMKDKSQMALDLMMRVRFFLSENITFNIRGGQSIGFKTDAPESITFLGAGVGVAF